MSDASVDETRAFDVATGDFTDCGGSCAAMPTARRFMRAATVGDAIYVIGGIDGLDVVEEYDPQTDTWTNCGGSCASMPNPRSSFALAVVDDRIYAIGGVGAESSVDEYDPATDTWTEKTAMPQPRFQEAAIPLAGTIWVMGGRNECCCGGTVDFAESYTPARDW